MMKNANSHIPPAADQKSWEALYERIRTLALKRSAVMIDEPEDEADAFDRGARALRTLMSAAEVARRMKHQDLKEQELHDAGETAPVVSDERIGEVYRSIADTVDRIEREDGARPGDRSDAVAVPSGTGGEVVEDQRP
ncbi:MAG: hypothetical protein AAFX54_14970 [Pseudomonadota bacterium]